MEMNERRRFRRAIGRCKECGAALIIAPDKTKCCPHCGLVIGEGYSWMGSEPAGNDHWDGAIDNMERILEGDGW